MSKPTLCSAIFNLSLAAACTFSASGTAETSTDGGDSAGGSTNDVDGGTTPTVLANTPGTGATGVPLDASVSATFSEAMDPATLTKSTFTLTSGPAAVPIQGTVVYGDSTAVFWPGAHLASNSSFTATITTGAQSASGVGLAAARIWSFTTGDADGIPVNLRTAGSYVILAKGGISGTNATVTGDLGVSPAAATYITGFSLIADATNVFSTSAQVTGRVYAADYVAPTPANLTAAASDMALAITEAAGRAPDVTELGAGNIGGMTLGPGVYQWTSGLVIPTNVTLAGGATAVWIFQIAQDLTMSADTNIVLTGGALPKNVFWQVTGGPVTIGTTAHFEGIVLTQTAVTVQTGATLEGRVLAQTAVIIDGSTVVEPAP